MINVPDRFKPKHPFPYPSDNHYEFERWYHDHYSWEPEERIYLPIFWTAYYCKHKFCQDAKAMGDLQKFLYSLDRSKRYYTIVQYDNGIQHDISHLDIMIFSMSGGRTDYPLPLISCPHEYNFAFANRPYTANFLGKDTHSIRGELILQYRELQRNNNVGWKAVDLALYCSYLALSIFTLCPRGFGPTSFRIQEALQFGSIPVYISDEFIIPHDHPFEEYGVLIHARDAHRTHEILSTIPEDDILRRQKAIPNIYQQYFTYEGNKEAIEKAVAECNNTAGHLPV